MSVNELAAFYDAVVAAAEAYGAHMLDFRITDGASLDAMLDFKSHIGGLTDRISDAMRSRTPVGLWERRNRSEVLIRHELRCGSSMAAIAALAASLAIERTS
ncbi:hypothetical protein ACI7BZ_12280 [Xanthobacter sp. AM11]|uniref:hypothetical protein n=1 Tax=Xanthobacter sp. AM11 TaxID=3380643 RepID=UPI0039BF4DC3